MRVSSTEDAPTLSRGDGLDSTILHGTHENPDTDLTVTWVEVDPGAEQVIHDHDPEQVYVVIAGEGAMTVGEERRAVAAGDLIHVPANTEHGIENTGDGVLEYVSAATPAFPASEVEAFYDA